jgi:hypothetical protein
MDKLFDEFLGLKETSIYVREGLAVAKDYAKKGKGEWPSDGDSDL